MMIRKRSLKVLSLVVSIILITSLLTGCGLLNACTTYPETEGLEIGFRYENEGPMITAVKSDKKEFDIDDVTLDFYYGGKTRGVYDLISVGVYFVNQENYLGNREPIDDYKNVAGYHLLKELTVDEYDNGPHEISILWSPVFAKDESKLYFHFCEEYTVPLDVLVGDYGTFYFVVIPIVYKANEKKYYFENGGGAADRIGIIYSKLEDNHIRLKEGYR